MAYYVCYALLKLYSKRGAGGGGGGAKCEILPEIHVMDKCYFLKCINRSHTIQFSF